MSIIRGTSGNDVLIGTTAAETISGLDGDDTIVGGSGFSDAGGDKLSGGAGNDSLLYYGTKGLMGLWGGGGDDILEAGYLNGVKSSTAQFHMFGGAGNDKIIMNLELSSSAKGHEGHHVYGGEGSDSFIFTGKDLNQGTLLGRIDDFDPSRDGIFIGSEKLDLNSLPNYARIVEYNGQQWLHIKGAGGGDALYALEGARHGGHEFHFTSFPDNISDLQTVSFIDQFNYVPFQYYQPVETSLVDVFSGNASIVGGVGNDWVYDDKKNSSDAPTYADSFIDGMEGDDVLNAGKGNDTVYGGVGNDLIAGGGDDDTLFGGVGNDSIWGGSENDLLYGETGDDFLYGGTGDDLIFGGVGDDRTAGNIGSDTLLGGDGNDSLDGGSWGDLLGGDGGNDLVDGQDGQDRLYGNWGSDTLLGGNGNDSLYGGSWGDILSGDAGNDLIGGDGGHDQLDGGSGNDRLYGGGGNDSLYGGTGQDLLVGGVGSDDFIFGTAVEAGIGSARDVISDLTAGQDQMDFTAMGMTFSAGSSFTNTAGEMIAVASGGNTILTGDVNGDGVADFELMLLGVTSVTAGMFV